MRKLLFMFAILVSGMVSAQEVSLQAGTFLSNGSIPRLDAERITGETDSSSDQKFVSYIEVGGDFFKSSKFRLGPVLKAFMYSGGLSSSINSTSNDYAFSAGADIGYDFNDQVTFGVGFELPIPDQRESIFEAVISPSLYIAKSKKLGIKINYDYFINKQLFQYHGAVTFGLLYKM